VVHLSRQIHSLAQAARRTSLSAASRAERLSVGNRHSTDRDRPSNIEPVLRVEDGNGRSKTRARADETAGHDLGLWSDGTAWSPACPRHHRAQAETVLNKVLDAGTNYIDTSIDYGLSEERIGRYISHRRAEYYLASKCGCLVGAPPAPPGQRGQHVFTRENVVAGVEQSLARMKTDYLDVVQFHSSPSRQTLEEHGALDALLELREAGKVRFIGMSGTLPHLIDHIAMGVFDVFQIPYSAVEREHEAAIATAAQNGAGIVIRGGAAKGAPTEGKQAGLQWERWRRAHLDNLLDGMTAMEFILRFTFTNPDLDTTIVGTINPTHLQTNLDILQQGPLPPDLYEEAKRRLAAAGSAPQAVGNDHFMTPLRPGSAGDVQRRSSL
jgi:aryl-alcohol dehydrogenase-like predicted oxidoreductase